MARPIATERALQKLIFAACRQLGLDDEARRDMQVSVTGKASLREMTGAELRLVADRLKSSGAGAAKSGTFEHKPAPRADLRLVHALWGKLGRAGKLDRPGRAGLNAFIRARFGAAWGSVPADIDMLRDHGQIDAVVQALLTWCRREGLEAGPR